MAESTITPYAAHKIVNVLLKEAGLEPIPSQMMYSYRKQNTGPKTWTESAVQEWAVGYVARRQERAQKTAEAVTAELAGE
jgi:hypothetical protein